MISEHRNCHVQLRHAYRVGLSICLCAIHSLQDEVPSDETFGSGSLKDRMGIRDALSRC